MVSIRNVYHAISTDTTHIETTPLAHDFLYVAVINILSLPSSSQFPCALPAPISTMLVWWAWAEVRMSKFSMVSVLLSLALAFVCRGRVAITKRMLANFFICWNSCQHTISPEKLFLLFSVLIFLLPYVFAYVVDYLLFNCSCHLIILYFSKRA